MPAVDQLVNYTQDHPETLCIPYTLHMHINWCIVSHELLSALVIVSIDCCQLHYCGCHGHISQSQHWLLSVQGRKPAELQHALQLVL